MRNIVMGNKNKLKANNQQKILNFFILIKFDHTLYFLRHDFKIL